MNFLLRIFAVGSLLTAVHSFAADAFEGKVTLAMTSDKGKVTTVNQTLKEGKLRIDMNSEGHQGATIMDMSKFEMTVLMPERNMYMVMPLKKPVEQEMAKHHEDPAANMDVQSTGKTETILGYKTDQIVMTDKDKGTTTEMWVAKSLGTFMGMGSGGSPFGQKRNAATAAKWEEALKGKSGFPLRVVTHDAKGNETFKMEATKIEPGPQPDSLFVPPPGYQKFEMPNLGGLNPFKHE